MIITMSPAKLMDFKKPVNSPIQTRPVFAGYSEELIEILKGIPADEIPSLMDINRTLAYNVYQQIQAFDMPRTPFKQAGYAYNGIAYLGLDMYSFDQADINYAQEHLIILSGLYGALRPMDMVKPHRLEMQINLANNKGENLYQFWSNLLTDYLIQRLEADDKIWVNLMSAEYTKVINRKKFPKDIHVITPNFKQMTANGYRQVVVYTKKARGMMSRYILKNRLSAIDDLKGFDEEEYTFSVELSNNKNWYFVR